jgi:hypothetical protein
MTHARLDKDSIMDMAAYNIWALARKNRHVEDAVPAIIAEIQKMMKEICFCNHEEARQKEYAKYLEQHKDAHLMYNEWLAWEKRINSIRCKVPAE